MSAIERPVYSARRTSPSVRSDVPRLIEPIGLGNRPICVLPFVQLGGMRMHAVTESQAIGYIMSELQAGRGGHVVTPNLDHLRFVRNSPDLIRLYREADLVVADGMPLIWASRLQRTPLPERVAGSNLITTLSAAAAERGRSVFLLGGFPGTADAAASKLRAQFPDLVVTGTYCPELGFEKNSREVDKILQILHQADPDIIYVALGSPKQERFIGDVRGAMPHAWWLGIGASFSFVSGQVRRAPVWVQRSGLEWAYRLMQEPRRLAKRYLVQGLPFAATLLISAAVTGIIRMVRSGQGH